jgi:hypothetical protein
MTMSQTGRILLYVNVALSLAFAFWAFGIYSQRIDRVAENKARVEQIDGLKKILASAEERWRAARTAAQAAENKRPELQKWYEEQLTTLRTGPGPVFALDLSKGQVKLDPTGRLLLAPVTDAAGKAIADVANLAALQKKYTEKQQTLRTTVQETDALVKQAQSLSDEIGPQPKKAGQKKTLRTELADVLQEDKNSQNEQEFLKPLLYNRQEEVKILEQRREELKGRLEQLQSVTTAQKP